MKAFADLADLPEDDRIALIRDAAATGRVIGFLVDNDEKADRYLRKLGNTVRYIDRRAWPRSVGRFSCVSVLEKADG